MNLKWEQDFQEIVHLYYGTCLGIRKIGQESTLYITC